MLATLIPLFDENLKVCAYSIFSQRSNYLLEPRIIANNQEEDEKGLPGLEFLINNDINMLASGKDVIVPVDSINFYSEFENQLEDYRGKIVLLLDSKIKIEERYLIRIRTLKELGFKLGMWKLCELDFEIYHSILTLFDYIFLEPDQITDLDSSMDFFKKTLPGIKIGALNVFSKNEFEALKKRNCFSLYEGEFYRMPISEGNREIAPLKLNYLDLLNIINDPDFDLTKAADVIGRDTALVMSLLEMANRLTINSEITSIRHATAMLGQREITHWINGYIAKELLADKPSEIMRLTLIRAKFAECLAPLFDLGMKSSELFLMGLFSLIDYMLDIPIKDALLQVNVSLDVKTALVSQDGPLAEVLHFMELFENAAWHPLSRRMIINNMDIPKVGEAYLTAVKWYGSMFDQKDHV